MTILVADVGGTNCRFALGDSAVDPDSMLRLRNADHPDFDHALDQFLANRPARLTAACIAVAGPVSDQKAELTNRGWHFNAARLSDRLGIPVRLLNDLAALGHALPALGPDGFAPVWTPANPVHRNGQAAVLGLGTGVNICNVALAPRVIFEAEAGHQSLPASVTALLGPVAAQFASVETLFSGRGLAQLHTALHRQTLDGTALMAAHSAGDARASQTLDLFARALGTWVQAVALQYLPRDGLYLAGSVARGLIQAGFGPVFTDAFTTSQRFGEIINGVPVRLVTDDMAALSGCLAAAA